MPKHLVWLSLFILAFDITLLVIICSYSIIESGKSNQTLSQDGYETELSEYEIQNKTDCRVCLLHVRRLIKTPKIDYKMAYKNFVNVTRV